jgi:DNA modification methylase
VGSSLTRRDEVTSGGYLRPVARPDDPKLAVGPERVILEYAATFDRVSHYLFRYPAKFHPPVVRALLEEYTDEGDVVLDAFCGSGSALVESALLGRSSIGIDVDPLAVAVTLAKVHRYQPVTLRRNAETLTAALARHRRGATWYAEHDKVDLTDAQYARELRTVDGYVPEIPNLLHWFRRYVVIDLARILRAILELRCSDDQRGFFEIVFASIIRNASNADPVPVSGLEVTSHMKRRDAEGRIVDPWALFDLALRRALDGAEAFSKAAPRGTFATAFVGDATALTDVVDFEVDAVLTSPPYHGAVDYYRRHQLEQFWLGLTETQADRLELLDHYIGRPKIPQRDRFVTDAVLATALAKEWEAKILEVSAERARAFRHYIAAMTEVFDGLADVVKPGGPALFIVGHSAWNGSEIPTTDLFAEISGDHFKLEAVRWYPVKNRYMSYARGNDANIDTEYVLVLRRLED